MRAAQLSRAYKGSPSSPCVHALVHTLVRECVEKKSKVEASNRGGQGLRTGCTADALDARCAYHDAL